MDGATATKALMLVKQYARIDYADDDQQLLPLMINAALQSMQELIPQFDAEKLTARQQLLLVTTVKHLYDQRELYGQAEDKLRGAAAGMLLSEIYEGRAVQAAQEAQEAEM